MQECLLDHFHKGKQRILRKIRTYLLLELLMKLDFLFISLPQSSSDAQQYLHSSNSFSFSRALMWDLLPHRFSCPHNFPVLTCDISTLLPNLMDFPRCWPIPISFKATDSVMPGNGKSSLEAQKMARASNKNIYYEAILSWYRFQDTEPQTDLTLEHQGRYFSKGKTKHPSSSST